MAEGDRHRALPINVHSTSPFAHFEFLVLRPLPMGLSAGFDVRPYLHRPASFLSFFAECLLLRTRLAFAPITASTGFQHRRQRLPGPSLSLHG